MLAIRAPARVSYRLELISADSVGERGSARVPISVPQGSDHPAKLRAPDARGGAAEPGPNLHNLTGCPGSAERHEEAAPRPGTPRAAFHFLVLGVSSRVALPDRAPSSVSCGFNRQKTLPISYPRE